MAARLSALPDAAPRNWFDRFAPEWLKPYGRLARWDRPIGWQLLLWPCWWSAALAALATGRGGPDPKHLLLFLIGAVAMRGAGCTFNDWVDRDLDMRVERTRARPLPSGALSSRQALVFLVAQSLVGLSVLLQLNTFTILLGVSSLAVVAVYPFMKRITDWPQLVLGLAFSWGALVGWSSALGSLGAAPLFLFAGSVFWTIGYDTIYALQDTADDAIVGVRSTARRFGENARPAIALFYAAAFICMGMALALAGAGFFAFAGLGAALLHAAWLLATLEPYDPQNCLVRFRAGAITGSIVFAGLLLDAVFRL